MYEFILTFLAAILIIVSWSVTSHLFNPLSVYTFVWYIGLLTATLNWVGFEEIDVYGWIIIGISCFAFALGFFTVVIAYKGVSRRYIRFARTFYSLGDDVEIDKVKTLIFLFCMISLISICYEWFSILRITGSFSGFLANANSIYSERIKGYGPPSIPYLPSFALAASALAGVQIARARQFNFLNMLPLGLVFLSNLASMGRTGIFMALGLYVTPYLVLLNIKSREQRSNVKGGVKLIVVVLLISLVVIMGTNFIRDARGGIESYSMPQSRLLDILQKIGLFRPSLYAYIGGPLVTFAESLYVDPNVLGRGEVPGVQTFAPFFRFLSKLGLSTPVAYYEEFVDIGIGQMNTGTYLKDVYIDFGIPGVVVFPYLLGFFVTLLYQRTRRNPNIFYLTAISFLYLYIEMSALLNLFRLGYYIISFAAALAGVLVISGKRKAIKLKLGDETVEFPTR